MTLKRWVSDETLFVGNFNDGEPSLIVEKNGQPYTVYHAQYPLTDVNLVVIEHSSRRGDGYVRRDYYFRSFPGKHSGQCATNEEAEPFYEEVRKTISRDYKIRARDLESNLRAIICDIESSLFMDRGGSF